jgi:hypothetical protein
MQLEHDPEKACPGLDPGWEPVSRRSLCSGRPKAGPECEARFGGRRKVGKDHAQSKSQTVIAIQSQSIAV